MGLAVDYLTRLISEGSAKEAFHVSLLGARNLKKLELATSLLMGITGTDDASIINACKMSGFDVAYRAGVKFYKPIENINPDKETINNIRIMVNRSLFFFDLYGPVTKSGFTFEGGYTDMVSAGDGDFLTKDTLWDFKVSKYPPSKDHTLQLLMYYLMGLRSIHSEFKNIKNLGVFNPRLNKVFNIPISSIPPNIIEEVSSYVIGY